LGRIGEWRGRVEGHGWRDAAFGRGSDGEGGRFGASGKGGGPQDLVDAGFGGIGGGLDVAIFVFGVGRSVGGRAFVVVELVDDLFEGEANGRGIEGFLGRGRVTEDGEGNVLGGVVVFVLWRNWSAPNAVEADMKL
jgi:hypothetical protein